MHRNARIVAGSLLLLGVSGCMHTRPPAIAGCAYRAIPLSVDSGGLQPAQPEAEPDALTAELRGVFTAQQSNRRIAPQGSAATSPPEYLVLSGGSQHGAFGAGFFYGMKDIPSYDVVTGVSTGSLQATFLFLANQPVPKDRSYGCVDGPLADIIKPGESNPGDLALAYSIAKEGDIVTPNKGGVLGGLAAGAMASFGPLRARLKAALSPDTLRAVAEQGAAPYNRKLFVGTVNLDDGRGYAIDLTELAARIDTPAWKGRTSQLQDCYADALVASSSVPPAAYPVSLEIADGGGTRTNLYMDGGARFGVFLEPILAALGDEVAKDARVDLIVGHHGAARGRYPRKPGLSLLGRQYRDLRAAPWRGADGVHQQRESARRIGGSEPLCLPRQDLRGVERYRQSGQAAGVPPELHGVPLAVRHLAREDRAVELDQGADSGAVARFLGSPHPGLNPG